MNSSLAHLMWTAALLAIVGWLTFLIGMLAREIDRLQRRVFLLEGAVRLLLNARADSGILGECAKCGQAVTWLDHLPGEKPGEPPQCFAPEPLASRKAPPA